MVSILLFSQLLAAKELVSSKLESLLTPPVVQFIKVPAFGGCPKGYQVIGSLEPQKGLIKKVISYDCQRSATKESFRLTWGTDKKFISAFWESAPAAFCSEGRFDQSAFSNSKTIGLFLPYGDSSLRTIRFEELDTSGFHLNGSLDCIENKVSVVVHLGEPQKPLDYCGFYLYRGKVLPDSEECQMYKDIAKNYEKFTKEVVCLASLMDLEKRMGNDVFPRLLTEKAKGFVAKINSNKVADVDRICREKFTEGISPEQLVARRLLGSSIDWDALDAAARAYLMSIPLALSHLEQVAIPVIAQAKSEKEAGAAATRANVCRANPEYLKVVASKDFVAACKLCEFQKGYDCNRVSSHVMRYISKKAGR